MYLVRGEEMAELDRQTINVIGIPGMVLMETAGLRVVKAIRSFLGELTGKKVTIMAGPGNNGGDGFVVARHLLNQGVEVKVMLVADPGALKGDAKTNYDILQRLGGKVFPIINSNSLNIVRVAMAYSDLLVDALYGTGFKGQLNEHVSKVVAIMNESKKPIVAVDIPSGVNASNGQVEGEAVRATVTVSFALPKFGQILAPGAHYCGKLMVVDIGIPGQLIEKQQFKQQLVTEQLVHKLLPRRKADSHKGDYGRVLIVAGSAGLTGAAVLAGQAALRCGAGLVTVAGPASLNGILAAKLTEAMTKLLPDQDGYLTEVAFAQLEPLLTHCDIIAIGPGLGTQATTQNLIRKLVLSSTKPVVLDADGLNAFIGHTHLFREAKAPLVLTPHPGELARLLGQSVDAVQADRLGIAQQFVQETGVTLVLKGFRTIIVGANGHSYINMNGNPGMATGGSGDVLTGLIAALIGQSLGPDQAAVAAAFLHGRAGDQAAKSKGMMGLIPSDMLEVLPQILQEMGEF